MARSTRKAAVLAALKEWRQVDPTTLCTCLHAAKMHSGGGSCGHSYPDFSFCKCSHFTAAANQNPSKEEMNMAAKSKGTKRASKAKAPRTAKSKEPKNLLITRYAVTAKAAPETLTSKEKDTLTAVLYRTVAAHKDGITRKEFLAAITPAQRKAFENNLQSTLFSLRKSGYLKVAKTREEVAAA